MPAYRIRTHVALTKTRVETDWVSRQIWACIVLNTIAAIKKQRPLLAANNPLMLKATTPESSYLNPAGHEKQQKSQIVLLNATIASYVWVKHGLVPLDMKMFAATSCQLKLQSVWQGNMIQTKFRFLMPSSDALQEALCWTVEKSWSGSVLSDFLVMLCFYLSFIIYSFGKRVLADQLRRPP